MKFHPALQTANTHLERQFGARPWSPHGSNINGNRKIRKDWEKFKVFCNAVYAKFEAMGLTRDQALEYVQNEIAAGEFVNHVMHCIRCDMTSKFGRGDEPFDMEKHTHRFAEFD